MAKTHGMARTPIYWSWKWMRQRTRAGSATQRRNPSYVGVQCCEAWATFEGFAADMLAGWFPGARLGRREDVGDYTPENCTWETAAESYRAQTEKRGLRLSDGRLFRDVAAQSGMSFHIFRGRIRAGWSEERALSTPVRAYVDRT